MSLAPTRLPGMEMDEEEWLRFWMKGPRAKKLIATGSFFKLLSRYYSGGRSMDTNISSIDVTTPLPSPRQTKLLPITPLPPLDEEEIVVRLEPTVPPPILEQEQPTLYTTTTRSHQHEPPAFLQEQLACWERDLAGQGIALSGWHRVQWETLAIIARQLSLYWPQHGQPSQLILNPLERYCLPDAYQDSWPLDECGIVRIPITSRPGIPNGMVSFAGAEATVTQP